MTITIAALVRWDDGRYAVPISPSWIHQKRVVYLVKGSAEIRDMKVTACTVASFSDDEVDSAFDIGVVLMDGGADIAVGNSAAEVLSKPPIVGQTLVASQAMLSHD